MNDASSVFLQDIWVHVAALLAIGIGFAGWYMTGLAHDPSSVELMFMIGGLAGLGVKIVNGSATVLAANTAANVVALATKTAAALPAAAAVKAAEVVETAAAAAAAQPPAGTGQPPVAP